MNGVMLGGKPLKCARPSNIPAALPLIQAITDEASREPRIYVSAIHQDLSESDIRSVFEAFGPIREYETLDAANDAVAAMNLFDLGGQFLRVGRAITPPSRQPQNNLPPELQAVQAAAAAANKAIEEALTAPPVSTAVPANPQPSRHRSRERGGGRRSRSRSRSRKHKKDKKKKRRRSSEDEMETQPAPAAPPAPEQVDEDDGLNAKEKAKKTIEQLQKGDNSISQEEEMSITGSNARFMIMQKRPSCWSSDSEFCPTVGHTSATVPVDCVARREKTTRVCAQFTPRDPTVGIFWAVGVFLLFSDSLQLTLASFQSSVMVLKNMVSFEDVDDDLENEIREECSKYGSVKKVSVYQEAQSEAEDAEVVVKIFVQFHKTSGISSFSKQFWGLLAYATMWLLIGADKATGDDDLGTKLGEQLKIMVRTAPSLPLPPPDNGLSSSNIGTIVLVANITDALANPTVGILIESIKIPFFGCSSRVPECSNTLHLPTSPLYDSRAG
eukprot:sb/3464081/